MKVSNPAEDPATLDMEALVALHAVAADPGLAIAQPRRTAARSRRSGGDDVLGRRALAWTVGASTGSGPTTCCPAGPGSTRTTLADPALIAWGETTARLGLALRSFIHPNAIRRLPWDVQHAASVRPMLAAVTDRDAAARSPTRSSTGTTRRSRPRWSALRSPGDPQRPDHRQRAGRRRRSDHRDHRLRRPELHALVADLASVLDSLAIGPAGRRDVPGGPAGARRLRAGAAAGDRWSASSWASCGRPGRPSASRSGRGGRREGLEEPEFAQRLNATALVMMEHMLTTGWERTRRACSVPTVEPAAGAAAALAARRDAVFGPAMEPLSYAEPIEMASASGVWMTDTVGPPLPRRVQQRGLPRARAPAGDLGDGPAVAGAQHQHALPAPLRRSSWPSGCSRPARRAWTRCCSSTPARRRTTWPGGSPATTPATGRPVHRLRLPRDHRRDRRAVARGAARRRAAAARRDLGARGRLPRTHLAPTAFADALDRLSSKGIAPAAAILDGVLQSDGVLDLDPAYVQELVRLTHAAGGLWIADEVQGGHGRTGEAMWSFERFGIEPDFVTLGKPMGNGQPVGAVITRRELVERFARDTVFFSTFGGNQVSMAAAHAVLDVLADERVLPRVRRGRRAAARGGARGARRARPGRRRARDGPGERHRDRRRPRVRRPDPVAAGGDQGRPAAPGRAGRARPAGPATC